MDVGSGGNRLRRANDLQTDADLRRAEFPTSDVCWRSCGIDPRYPLAWHSSQSIPTHRNQESFLLNAFTTIIQ